MFTLTNRGRIADPAVVQEFERLFAKLRGFLSQSFDADGNLVVADPNLAIVPVGALQPFAGPDDKVPSGWRLCDGNQVSRITYKALFDVIGTTWGAGDGSTTFNLPDLRQRFLLGKAASGTGDTLGATGGAIDHVHSGPSHSHSISTASDHQHAIGSHTHDFTTGSGGAHSHTVDSHDHGGSTSFAGGVGVPAPGSGGFDVSVPHAHDIASEAPNTDVQGSHSHTGTTDLSASALSGSGGGHDHGGATGSAGNGNTGTSNPPFAVVNWLIFAGV